jgi:hypothetical protein
LEPTEEGSSGEIDDKSPGFDVPNLYDYVYSNLPDDVHVLKPIDDCKK